MLILPSPRVRMERLRLGGADPEKPSLSAALVEAELALTPLLGGEIRFRQVRIARAEIRIPVSPGRVANLPTGLLSAGAPREWPIDELAVAQLLVTTVTPETGRTDLYAEEVRIAGNSLVGPWRIEGLAGAVPFHLVTGAIGADGSIRVMLTGGGDRAPRFDIDAKLALTSNTAGVLDPALGGTAKVFFGPPAQTAAAFPIPMAVQSSFKLSGRSVRLDALTVEAGEGAASLRLAGAGSVRLDEPRASFRLEGKRIDVDSFILWALRRDLTFRGGAWSPLPLPVDLDLKVSSIGFAHEDLSDLNLRATLERSRAILDLFEIRAPGETRVALAGTVGLSTEGGADGRISVASDATDRLARYLGKLGVPGPFMSLLDGPRLDAATEVVVALPVISLRNAKVDLGNASLTGNLRLTAPEGAERGRLEAQVAVHGLDLDALPQMTGLFEATRAFDLDLIMNASAIRYGAQAGAGRITAHVESDGQALAVRMLEIVDLAGANARVSGRIAPDGSGRITGKVRAARAAPIIDLLGRVWIGDVSRLAPGFLRDGGLDLDIVAERAAGLGSSGELALLQTTIRGTAAGARFEADVLSAEGRTERLGLDSRLTTREPGSTGRRSRSCTARRISSSKGRASPAGSI